MNCVGWDMLIIHVHLIVFKNLIHETLQLLDFHILSDVSFFISWVLLIGIRSSQNFLIMLDCWLPEWAIVGLVVEEIEECSSPYSKRSPGWRWNSFRFGLEPTRRSPLNLSTSRTKKNLQWAPEGVCEDLLGSVQ